MKKIFAIALALVMVLSMASAFASPCTAGFDWTCASSTTNCGQGTVELVPYVKVNNSCGGYDWQVSECASAVSGERVFYAIKLTVDANADEDWWKKAAVELTYKGMAAAAPAVDKPWSDVKKAIKAEDTADEVNVFYYNFATTAWDIVNDDFVLANKENTHVKAEKVGNKAADAKICVELTSAWKGTAGVVGDYYVVYAEGVDAVAAKDATKATLTFTVDEGTLNKSWYPVDWSEVSVLTAGGKTTVTLEYKTAGKLSSKALKAVKDNVHGVVPTIVDGTAAVKAVEASANAIYVYDEKDGKLLVTYTIKDGKIGAIDYTAWCGEAAYATIKAFFGLEIGTCVDKDLIAANFGWDFEQKDCFEWSDKAASIVDAECVVAIPKTGDASVLAWLF